MWCVVVVYKKMARKSCYSQRGRFGQECARAYPALNAAINLYHGSHAVTRVDEREMWQVRRMDAILSTPENWRSDGFETGTSA
jgi:hypothetical protein